MLKVIKVTGESLSPSIHEGDYVLLGTCSFFFPVKVGDKVVFQHPQYGRMIKVVSTIENSGTHLRVRGSHPNSVDSRDFGPISKDTLLGKVLLHISDA